MRGRKVFGVKSLFTRLSIFIALCLVLSLYTFKSGDVISASVLIALVFTWPMLDTRYIITNAQGITIHYLLGFNKKRYYWKDIAGAEIETIVKGRIWFYILTLIYASSEQKKIRLFSILKFERTALMQEIEKHIAIQAAHRL